MRSVKEKIEQILNLKNLPPEIVMVTDNVVDPGVLADLVASNLRLKIEESQSILEIYEPVERLTRSTRCSPASSISPPYRRASRTRPRTR